jgi:putative ABC transport system permease protein
MLLNYFKIAWRMLTRNKVYTAINVLGLALGICSCLVIFLITHFELSYDTFHPGKERIYRITGEHSRPSGESRKLGFVPDPMAMTIRTELTGLETVAGFYNYHAKVSIPNGKNVDRQFERPKYNLPSDVIVADPQYFELFKYQWLAGNPATALQQPFQVVLTEQEARKYFGAGSADQFMGRPILYDDSLHMTVSGIVKDLPANTDFAFKDFISFSTIRHSFLKKEFDLNAWGMWDNFSQAFIKLAPGVTPAQIQRQFPAFQKKYLGEQEGDKSKVSLQPLSDIHFNDAYPDAFSRKASLPTLYILMGVAAFILLIAAINFINLSTAQSIQRVKEIGIRKVLGGRRRSLVFQFLVETFVLTCLAVLLSLLLIKPVLSAFHAFIPAGLSFHLFDPANLLFLGSITLVTSLLAGFYPAKILSSYLPVISLKGEGGQTVNRKSYLRQSLIVFQFTIALLFIIGTWIMGDQIRFLLNADMGFNKTAVLNIPTPRVQNAKEKRKLLLQKIGQISTVAMECTSEGTPAAVGHRGTDIMYKGKDLVKVSAEMHLADDKFLSLYELKLLAGRNLLRSDTMSEVLLNESCARALGFKKPEDAVGQLVESGQKDNRNQGLLPVVGVVADFHSRSLKETVGPVFISSNADASRIISVKLSMQHDQFTGLQNTLAKIQQDWKEIYPDNKFEYTFFDETIAAFYDKEQKTASIMNTAMFMAIFISCMGLFGVTTFMAGQRTREIGIRKVLGASVTGIVQLLTIDFVRLIGISILIASPIAWYFMHRWLQDFAYRTSIHPWIFAGAGLTALFIALATVSFQAIRAATANPVKSLRSE